MIQEEVRVEWRKMRETFPQLQMWILQVDHRPKRRLGLCRYAPKIVSLSSWLVRSNNIPQIIDTLRHECAHALAGCYARHGREWKTWARILGARPKAAANLEGSGIKKVTRMWVATCPRCGQTFTKYRRSRMARFWRCGACSTTQADGTKDAQLFRWTKKIVEKVY